MTNPKDQVAESIVRARTELEHALGELEKIPAFDPGAVAFAAHAINNFLTVTGGTTELLMLSLKDYPNPQIRVWLEGIQQATSMMAHIATDLINNASITSAPKLQFEKVDIAKLIPRGCDFYQRQADVKGIRITWKCRDEPLLVWVDRVALAAVMDNLLSNAVKYSPPSATIHIEAFSDPPDAVVWVQDEGLGLSAEEQKLLFQRGASLSAVPTGGEPSTGYGLAVAKELMTLLNGAIWCESEEGKGARFGIRLPKHNETP